MNRLRYCFIGFFYALAGCSVVTLAGCTFRHRATVKNAPDAKPMASEFARMSAHAEASRIHSTASRGHALKGRETLERAAVSHKEAGVSHAKESAKLAEVAAKVATMRTSATDAKLREQIEEVQVDLDSISGQSSITTAALENVGKDVAESAGHVDKSLLESAKAMEQSALAKVSEVKIETKLSPTYLKAVEELATERNALDVKVEELTDYKIAQERTSWVRRILTGLGMIGLAAAVVLGIMWKFGKFAAKTAL